MLKINNVTYRYEGTKKDVLKNINAEFEEGMIYAIVGRSGSGKTTLLSLISGLDKTTEGEVLYNDKNLSTINRDDYRANSIGVIFQNYNLLTNITALENVVLSMSISGVKKDKKKIAYDLLESVGIDKVTANRKTLKLSGGEQQRVAIARAISHAPNIIIADEPTGNLDTDTEKDIMEILSSFAKKEKKCVIIVSHSKKAVSFADRIYTMNNGVLSV